MAEPPITPEPTQQDYFEAAQCWCDPTTSALVMQPELAIVIARAIARARHAGEVAERERCARLADAYENDCAATLNDSRGQDGEAAAHADAAHHIAAAIRSLAPDTEGKA